MTPPLRILVAPLVAPLFALAALLAAGPAAAEPAASQESASVLSAGAGADSSGRIAVNIAAGNGNAQANIAAVASSRESAAAALNSAQRVTASAIPLPGGDTSAIGAEAFRNARGIVSVNQSSGDANAQANLAGFSAGANAEVSIAQLGHVVAADGTGNAAPAARRARPERLATIADSAFAGARGLVQVNQLAGTGNATANIFSLTVTSGPQ